MACVVKKEAGQVQIEYVTKYSDDKICPVSFNCEMFELNGTRTLEKRNQRISNRIWIIFTFSKQDRKY